MSVPIEDIPEKARALLSFGPKTTKAVIEFFSPIQVALFRQSDEPISLEFSSALSKKQWTDDEVSSLMSSITKYRNEGIHDIDFNKITRWILAHDNGGPASAIVDCMDIIPPKEIEIIRVLSTKGSQKVVFLASWNFRQQEVVIKRVLGNVEYVKKIINRELQPHPFSMVHKNIIETHIMQNINGETFLVERRLKKVLSDAWRADGVHEAANLMCDIINAMKYLHVDQEKIHGDIKPDNIGIRDGNFLLLDFGICRNKNDFTEEATPTGSIRTRAPELLFNNDIKDPEKIDIWALGATVFNSLAGRFPLITNSDEPIPRISNPDERQKFEKIIAERAEKHWDKYVDLSLMPHSMRDIIGMTLLKNPDDRPNSKDLLSQLESTLPAYIKSRNEAVNSSAHFSPIEELSQIDKFLKITDVSIIPETRRLDLLNRLDSLNSTTGIESSEIDPKSLIDKLSPNV